MLRRIHIVAAFAAATGALAAFHADAAGRPALLSRSLVQGPARTAAFGAGGLVLGTGGGLAVFDDAGRLAEPVFLPLDGEPQDLCLRGNVAYVAAFTGGLVTIDLSDPKRPVASHRHEMAQASLCASAGGSLMVCDGRRRIHVFTLENPREPRFEASRDLPHSIVAMRGEGDLLAIVYGSGADIFRAGAGGSLERAAAVALPADAKDAVIQQAVLCVLTAAGEILAWDIERPDDPKPLSGFKHRRIAGIAAGDGGGALLGAARTIIPFSVERSAGGARIRVRKAVGLPPRAVTATGTEGGCGPGSSREIVSIAVSSERIAAIAPLDGVGLYAIERNGLRALDFFPTRGYALGVAVEEGIVCVANGNDGVRIGRIGNDGTIGWISHLQTKDARGVALSGANLFVADGAGGIRAADVSDPARPRLVGAHASPFYMSALVVRGGRAYCAGGLGGAEIVDVSDPRRPRLVWRRAFSEVRGLDADERYLYVADGYEGLRIFALDGREPRQVSTLDTPGWTCDVSVAGDRAYLADGGRGIVVADVASRERPRIVGSAPTGAVARQVRLHGSSLYVAAFTEGLIAFDVSHPAHPVETVRFRTVGDARGVSIAGAHVLVACGAGGLYVLSHSQ